MGTYQPLSDGLTIQKSSVQGLGVFTTKYIDKDVNLGMTHVVVDDEIIRTPLGGFINHSDTPNCIKVRGVLGREDVEDYNKYFLYTKRPIRAWEELTLKYTFYKIKTESERLQEELEPIAEEHRKFLKPDYDSNDYK